MASRNTRVKVKMLRDCDGVPKGSVLVVRTSGFTATVLEGEFIKNQINKNSYRVIAVLPETADRVEIG